MPASFIAASLSLILAGDGGTPDGGYGLIGGRGIDVLALCGSQEGRAPSSTYVFDWSSPKFELHGGNLAADDVRKTIRVKRNQIIYCKESSGHEQEPSMPTELVLELEINRGIVTQAAATTEPKDDKLTQCVAERAKTWAFPKAKDGKPVSVHFPFSWRIERPTPP